MAGNHAIVNTTKICAWDVDALNLCGIAEVDLDNGALVTLSNITKDTVSGAIEGYQYAVAPATASSKGVWVVDTPEVGATLEDAYLADPRYFYNKAGKPMSLRYLMPMVDCIEVDARCFASGVLPTNAAIGQFVGTAASGKLGAPQSSAPASAYFRVEGLHTIDVGQELVPTVVLRCMDN